jgi:hypothetical protein
MIDSLWHCQAGHDRQTPSCRNTCISAACLQNSAQLLIWTEWQVELLGVRSGSTEVDKKKVKGKWTSVGTHTHTHIYIYIYICNTSSCNRIKDVAVSTHFDSSVHLNDIRGFQWCEQKYCGYLGYQSCVEYLRREAVGLSELSVPACHTHYLTSQLGSQPPHPLPTATTWFPTTTPTTYRHNLVPNQHTHYLPSQLGSQQPFPLPNVTSWYPPATPSTTATTQATTVCLLTVLTAGPQTGHKPKAFC